MAAAREVLVRHARKNGRSVAILRAVDYGDSCVVEAEVFPTGRPFDSPVRPGPYTFADQRQASEFIAETTRALLYLGCDVQPA